MSASRGALGAALIKNDDSAYALLGSPDGLRIGDVTYRPRTWQVADPLTVSKGLGSSSRDRTTERVLSEIETRTVPVSLEEVRVEPEPITDGNAGNAVDAPSLSEEEHEVVLSEERPVVRKEHVPVERVRLDKETVTEDLEVSEDARKERIDMDSAGDDRYPDGGMLRTTVEDAAHSTRSPGS